MAKKRYIKPTIEMMPEENHCEGCKYEDKTMCLLTETKKGFNPMFGWGGTACFGTGYHVRGELFPKSVIEPSIW